MKELVSKNPIQRFKQGKVIKAESGFKTAKRHDYAKGAVKYQQDKNGRWLANYVNGPDTKQYYIAEGSTGYDRFGNHNILQNGEWVRIKGQSNQGIVGKNGITKTESFNQRAKANGFNGKDEVKQLQEKLASIGLYDGNIDGLWGVKTQAAFDQLNNVNYKAPKTNTNKPKVQNTQEVQNTQGTTAFGNSKPDPVFKHIGLKDVGTGTTLLSDIVAPQIWAFRNFKHNWLTPGERPGQFKFGLVDNPELILKQGGQITKAQGGTKFNGYQKADRKTVDTLNKYFESTPNEKLIKSQEYIAPGSYNLQGVTFNRRNIRDNRNMYKTVDDYWNYLNSDEGKKSNDFQLWSNIMRTQDGALNREVFDNVMSKYGISGNLGRRDSGRLANVLNTLNEIGTNGSEARKAFIDSYNTAFIPATEARVANVAPTGTPTSIIINRNTQPVSTQSVSTTRRFVIPDFAGLIRSQAQLSPFFRYAKQGGKLISRNPVKQFKQK